MSLTYQQIIKKGVRHRVKSKVIFNADGLSNIMSGIAVSKINLNDIDDNEIYTKHIISLLSGENKTSIHIRRYVLSYHREMIKTDKLYKTKFHHLKNGVYNIGSFIVEPKIDEFVCEYVTDGIYSFKGYGLYEEYIKALDFEIFLNVSDYKLKSFFKNIKLDKHNSIKNSIHEIVKNKIPNQLQNINNKELLMIYRILDYRYSSNNQKTINKLRFGLDLVRFNNTYFKKIETYSYVINNIINHGLTLNIDKGIQR